MQIQSSHAIPHAPVQTVSFRKSRPQIVGSPAGPEPPFPIHLVGRVQRGFGRGGKDLGCPTANLPDESIAPLSSVARTGVYYGWAQVTPLPHQPTTTWTKVDSQVLPMVMSMGWNPFYHNQKLTCEIHVIHEFSSDFYGYELRAIVLGYIRPELDYTSREALIADIETDKQVALNSLARPEYQKYSLDPFFPLHSHM
ncbi:Flavokinase-domain-containing protein [Fistulina hepatica ATCC 64428]|uniref:Riboflavin kinase n=1 Tax=Fistulina hepatica ATCC 64428 TaxID=1128425 RepID=A0A0D7A7G2_9AGAR|nr:Flavokinase-domain-containing protein [Fistulina hepatica ATCC 64428]